MARAKKFVVVIYCGDHRTSDGIGRSLRDSMRELADMGYSPEEHENGRRLRYCWNNGGTRARIMYYDEWERIYADD